MMLTYRSRRAFADQYLNAQLSVLSECFNVPTNAIALADDETDKTQATDAIIDHTRIALRVRRSDQLRYADDFTIRTTKDANGLSEWDKVRAGHVHYMLYAFGDDDGGLKRWTLIDLSKIKRSAAVERQYVGNRGGGSFLAFRLSDCRAAIVEEGTAKARKAKAQPARVEYSEAEKAEGERLLREAVDEWHRLFAVAA